ncbi:hypothetical protein EVAR_4770_1 [Eumeta japonica]|uniref:Uncharacterized protein n=1 Tax=Eumeta variegata TaxID=151549 RepID=A0A4C1SZN5_EUMVA|nr:hypothetical protein EVAR_4770_1 [Eumeta japonica]
MSVSEIQTVGLLLEPESILRETHRIQGLVYLFTLQGSGQAPLWYTPEKITVPKAWFTGSTCLALASSLEYILEVFLSYFFYSCSSILPPLRHRSVKKWKSERHLLVAVRAAAAGGRRREGRHALSPIGPSAYRQPFKSLRPRKYLTSANESGSIGSNACTFRGIVSCDRGDAAQRTAPYGGRGLDEVTRRLRRDDC